MPEPDFHIRRVPIQLKLLLLLLAISLIPLVIFSVLEFRNTRQLGKNLAERTRVALTNEGRQWLHQWIDEKAAWVNARRSSIEQVLRSQAREVERCLATRSTRPVPVYYTDDFDHVPPSPPGMISSPRHRRFDPVSSAFTPMSISYQEPSFYLAPGVTHKSAASTVALLAPLKEAYRFLNQVDPHLILWQYTALEEGASCSYPGHGNEPAGYDPRKRNWYLLAKEKGSFSTFGPYVDASTKNLVLTLSIPVRHPNGSFAGVTALDMTIEDLAKNLKLPESWPSHSVAMLVSKMERNGQPALKVVASPGYRRGAESWDSHFEGAWLESSDAESMQKMIQNMNLGFSGIELMPYQHRPCFWGYGLVEGKDLFLVAIIPQEKILQEAFAAQNAALDHTRQQLGRLRIIFVMVILSIILIALISSRTVTRPLRDLVSAVRCVAEGSLDTRVKIRTRDEIEELGEAFNRMAPQLQDRVRLKNSIDLAREVQQNLLPAHPPLCKGFDIAGRSVYCDETGGDYYGYLQFSREGREQLGIVLGDVTGHGIAAAMLMATARSLLRANAELFSSLGNLMEHANRQLASDVTGGRFMTLYFLLIDLEKKMVRWSSAGHDPAIKYNPSSKSFEELAGAGLPFGIDPRQNYREQGPLPLGEGEIIVIGTDGIWEARNPQGERFGKDRLRAVIQNNAGGSADSITRAIFDSVSEFRKTHPQEDDITLVVVKVSGA